MGPRNVCFGRIVAKITAALAAVTKTLSHVYLYSVGLFNIPDEFTLKGQHNLFGHALNRHFTDIGPSLASKVDTPRVSLQILLNPETAAALIWDQ